MAVAAEIVAVRRGGSGLELRATDTAIHRLSPDEPLGPPPMESTLKPARTVLPAR